MNENRVARQGKTWLSAFWAVLPLLVVGAVLVGGKSPRAPASVATASVAGVPSNNGLAGVIAVASIDAPASADEPMARYGQ